MNNKNGFSYIMTCVCILVVMMLVGAAMQYAFVYHVARTQKNETQLTLDSYVTRYAVDNFDALKQGQPWETHMDSSALVEGAYTALGFSKNTKSVTVDGRYVMTRPTITALGGDAFGVQVAYEISIPFELFGKEIAQIKVPVTIVAQFKQK